MKDILKKTEEVKVEETKLPVEKTDKESDILQDAVKKVAKVESSKQYVVKPMRLNVRQEPTETARIVGTVSEGDVLTIQESSSVNPSWKKVTAPINGYVIAAFLEVKR